MFCLPVPIEPAESRVRMMGVAKKAHRGVDMTLNIYTTINATARNNQKHCFSKLNTILKDASFKKKSKKLVQRFL